MHAAFYIAMSTIAKVALFMGGLFAVFVLVLMIALARAASDDKTPKITD